MRLGLMISAALLSVSATQPLAAQNSGVSAAQVFAAFEGNGFELSEPSSNGTRVGKMALGGEKPVNVNIRPVECTDNQNCKAVIMYANFKLTEVTDDVKAAIGKFNDSKYFGRAYYVSDKVGVDSVIRVDSAGDIPYLRRRITDFRSIVNDFLKHMRGK